ncbi:hypothetical protein FOIG_16377 [Fusarium odoratissimum NRRL 54006]|uniref:Uncharacterized protein n=1 Tax=Fusarium odoratissimum (strain NRRL 54006) TaxID=1089451 RepID=X0ING0_FUSO5|nr:uncharacterized protein FOIG_16377 [Fusarium odoratissimum NRRL 54006]EXL90377.1 hypothetical protein FOIG_16377 [Fusarium odoratissimum NRRL 54006]
MSDPLDPMLDDIYRLSATEPISFDTEGYEEYKMPQLVSELKPVGVINTKGKLIGVRFQNFIGDDTNVVALSNIIPKAPITVDVNPDSAHYIAIPVLSKDFMTNLTAGYREVEMQLRTVRENEYIKDYTPLKLRKGGLERDIIVVPGSMPLFSGRGRTIW